MHRLFFILVFLYNSIPSFAQQEALAQAVISRSEMDTLHNLLLQEKEDSNRVKYLLRLSRGSFQMGQFDSQIYYAQKALQLSQNKNLVMAQTTAYDQLVWGYRQTGKYVEALQTAFKNLQLAEATKDSLYILEALRHVTFTYLSLNDFEMALAYVRRTKALVHSGFFKNEKESRYHQMRGYMNFMGAAFDGLGKEDSSYYYRKVAYETAQYIQDNQLLALTSESLARYFNKNRNYDSAFYYYHLCIDFIKKAGFRFDLLADAHYGLATIFKNRADRDSAIYYAKLSLYSSYNMKRLAPQVAAATLLHSLYEKDRIKDSAYKYLYWASTYKDSLFNLEKIKEVENVKYNEALRLQQRAHNEKLAQQRFRTRVKLFSLIGGFLLALVVAVFLYRNNRQKQKANTKLQQQKLETEQALKKLKETQAQLIQHEKMASLGELTAGIAHEIQNPLNFVTNFSEVSAELAEEIQKESENGNKEEVILLTKSIKDNLHKIMHHGRRADSIVKNMMEHSKNVKGDKQLVNINALVDEYMRIAYHAMKSKDKTFAALLNTHFDTLIGKISLVPQDIGRVLLNLFNNAFYSINVKKSQLNGTFEPTVDVSTRKVGNHVELSVKDNGTGIPNKVLDKIYQPFFTTKPTGEGTGLGLSLSYDIITKVHGGEIKVETKEGEYTEFIIQLPL